jgi:hypothetical protein
MVLREYLIILTAIVLSPAVMVRVLSPNYDLLLLVSTKVFPKALNKFPFQFPIFNIVTKILYSHPTKSIFKFLINLMGCTFF